MNSPRINNAQSMFFVYGPPGSGKSSTGRLLAQALDVPFWDVDAELEARSRMSIPKIFAKYGEAGFRKQERKVLERLLSHSEGVISLGGGALLDTASRAHVEALGPVVCLQAGLETLLSRLDVSDEQRPLLDGDLRQRLEDLLAVRQEHYASFPLNLETDGLTSAEIAWQAQVRLGAFHVRGMGSGYDVRVQPGGLDRLGEMLVNRGLRGPVVIVSDENVAPLYTAPMIESLSEAGLTAHLAIIPPGEQHKTQETVATLWEAFTRARLDRGSTVVALGGGVVGDLAGFAAATFLRGISWVAVPTTLLAMVDASLGGKTGFDLPSGKNLVGAFHAPRLVLADPRVLDSLPEDELRSGLAEVVKHGVISDPSLFALCAQGWEAVQADLDALVRHAMAVKVRIIQIDPYEGGLRAALNLGHTLGHAVEQASSYSIRHGEAVSIGMVAAARMSERLELAQSGLAEEIAVVLQGLGLPTEVPASLNRASIQQYMGLDKKRAGGKVRFVLPLRVGEVKTGVETEGSSQIFELLIH
jgi:shikimate kinase/3-dehydroquinate synthase